MTIDTVDTAVETLPIGPFQEGLWLFWRLNPTSPAYSMPEVFHFEGEFDRAAAETAFAGLLRRHPGLRTRFRETPDGVVQVVDRDPHPAGVAFFDLTGVSEDAREHQLAAIIDEESNRPFDLAAGPAVRLTAITVRPLRTSLVLVSHHIVCDGTSMAVVLEELGELYRAARAGEEPALPPPAPGYPDFVRRQLANLADGSFDEARDFWRERLADMTASILPGDGGSAAPGALDTCVVSTTLDGPLVDAVHERARAGGATPFSVLLSAMDVLVATATGEGDVALGTAASGRTRRFRGTVGMLANTLVLRSRIDQDATFTEVVREVSLDLVDALEYQGLPFARVAADIGDAGRGTDVVRTMFGAGANGRLSFGEGTLSGVVASSEEGPFDLVAVCFVADGEIAVDWEFALRTYSADAARGWASAYVEVLRTLLTSPQVPVGTLGLSALASLPVAGYVEADRAAGSTAPDPAAAAADDGLTPFEAAVADVWASVLEVPVRRPEDDFFRLGGHSMLASQTVTEVRRTVAPDATLRLLFDRPRLRDFCAAIKPSTGPSSRDAAGDRA